MSEYEFELHFKLPESANDSEMYLDALFESGCDDALLGLGKPGYIALDFTREAPSAAEALKSAVENVLSAIPEAELVSATPDLVNISDMSKVMKKWEVLDLTRQAIRNYAIGKTVKVTRPFPSKAFVTESPLWHINEVVVWLIDNGKVEQKEKAQQLLEVSTYTRKLNAALEYARNKAPIFDNLVQKIVH